MRACTGSFAKVCRAFYTKNIEVGQILGLSKNGSWAVVDTHSSFSLGHAQEASDFFFIKASCNSFCLSCNCLFRWFKCKL